ncbi:hypothetical protein AMTR_s00129p00124600 [Amborella trichopoda]|uniref:Uncharacterized protein n=1 Tax=Amborella trichopoda TaxID=13333 RepID=W1NJW9_AMBTC|nr:hypothetical protein AMTR_s00129p00124600 [Amborella trichopoda]
MGSSEEELAVTLDDLQKKLGKKNSFEDAVTSIQVLLHDTYPVASPPLKEKIYSVVCRVGTILQTRYTAPGFWVAGLRLFEETECLVSKQSEKENMRMFISRAREHMMEIDNQPDSSESARNNARGIYHCPYNLNLDNMVLLINWT